MRFWFQNSRHYWFAKMERAYSFRYHATAVYNDMPQVERCQVDRVALMQTDDGLYQFNYNYARMQRYVPRADLSYIFVFGSQSILRDPQHTPLHHRAIEDGISAYAKHSGPTVVICDRGIYYIHRFLGFNGSVQLIPPSII